MQLPYRSAGQKKRRALAAGLASYTDSLLCLCLVGNGRVRRLASSLDRQLPPLRNDLLALFERLLAQTNRFIEVRVELSDRAGLRLAQLLIEGLEERRLLGCGRLPELIELLHLRIDLILHDLAFLGLWLTGILRFHPLILL